MKSGIWPVTELQNPSNKKLDLSLDTFESISLSGRNRPGIFAFEFLLIIFAFEFFDFDQWILTSQKEMADLGAVLAVHLTFRLTHPRTQKA